MARLLRELTGGSHPRPIGAYHVAHRFGWNRGGMGALLLAFAMFVSVASHDRPALLKLVWRERCARACKCCVALPHPLVVDWRRRRPRARLATGLRADSRPFVGSCTWLSEWGWVGGRIIGQGGAGATVGACRRGVQVNSEGADRSAASATPALNPIWLYCWFVVECFCQ